MIVAYKELIAAVALDGIVGDPQGVFHPVNAIAGCATLLESPLRAIADSAKEEVIAGSIMATLTLASTVMFSELCSRLGTAARIALIASALAGNSLYRAGTAVRAALECSTEEARRELSLYVGRSTEQLDESQICKASVETIAENTCDGYIAPLFWATVGSCFGHGASFVWAYKAISTLDSLYGYTTRKNLYFGRLAARMDDVAAYIPARISAVCIVLASLFIGENFVQAYRCVRDEHNHHESPNAGWSEAAYAGALQLHLGGSSRYGDRIIAHPHINEHGAVAKREDIARAQKLFVASAVIAGCAACTVLYLAKRSKRR